MAITTVDISPNALVSEEDAIAYIAGTSGSGTAPVPPGDDLLRRIINAQSARIEKWTGRVFKSRTLDETYSATGGKALFLRQHPLISVTTLEWLDHAGTVIKTYPSAEYRLDLEHGLIRLTTGERFARGVANWHVVYIGGFNTIPDDPALACLILVARSWRDFEHTRDDIESQNVDGQLIVYSQKPMPPKVQGLLGPWKLPTFGGL